MLLPAITFTTEAVAVRIIQLHSLQWQQQHLVSSPPPLQWGGENRPCPPSPFSSSGKDKDWSHPPMMVVEEE